MRACLVKSEIYIYIFMYLHLCIYIYIVLILDIYIMSFLCYDCSKLFYTNEYWLKNVNVLAHMFVVHAYLKLQSKWYRHTYVYKYIYILVFQSAINMNHSTTWRSEAPSRISACCARRRLFGSEHFALHRLHLNSIWFIYAGFLGLEKVRFSNDLKILFWVEASLRCFFCSWRSLP